MREMPPEHAPVVRALQDALMELVAEGEGCDEDVGSTDMECEPCPPPEPTELEQQQATEQEQIAAAFFEQVAEELAWTDPTGALPSGPLAMLRASFNGCAGGLILTPYQLMWVAAGSHFSRARVRVPLTSIRQQRTSLLKSPFANRAEFIFSTSEHAAGSLVRFECGSELGATEAFAREVGLAMDAIPGAATSVTATSATIASAADGHAATATSATARRQTKQVLAAVDLRAKLKQVVELQRSHAASSNSEADAILTGLEADSTEPSMNTVYKESQQLRDVALGFGGYALAKRVIEQFIKMPMVRLLLPKILTDRQSKMADAEYAVELMGHAKGFFTGIFGVGFRGGRLSDEDRNAVAAASAAFTPRDLFKKRGRAAAASRLSGQSYRQLHRGSDARRELERTAPAAGSGCVRQSTRTRSTMGHYKSSGIRISRPQRITRTSTWCESSSESIQRRVSSSTISTHAVQ